MSTGLGKKILLLAQYRKETTVGQYSRGHGVLFRSRREMSDYRKQRGEGVEGAPWRNVRRT